MQLTFRFVFLGHEVYWHYTPVEAHPCVNCRITFSVENSLMEIVQSINPGQPELPEWVYNGAILGVQGGTTRMLEILEQVRFHFFSSCFLIMILFSRPEKMMSKSVDCGFKIGPARLSLNSELECFGTGDGTRPGIQIWIP